MFNLVAGALIADAVVTGANRRVVPASVEEIVANIEMRLSSAQEISDKDLSAIVDILKELDRDNYEGREFRKKISNLKLFAFAEQLTRMDKPSESSEPVVDDSPGYHYSGLSEQHEWGIENVRTEVDFIARRFPGISHNHADKLCEMILMCDEMSNEEKNRSLSLINEKRPAFAPVRQSWDKELNPYL